MGKMCAKHSYDRSVVSNGFGYIAILFEVYYMRGREKKRTHYLFMFYKIVNVCLMVWSIEYSRFDQFRFGFSSFYAILFLFPSFWLLLPTPILLLLFFLFLMHWRKLLEWNCWTRSFGDVDHFANKLFNRQKKQYKTLFFHKYYREFCIHVSKHGEDKIDRFNHNICINSMLYEAEQRRYLLYRKKYCVMRS